MSQCDVLAAPWRRGACYTAVNTWVVSDDMPMMPVDA